MSTSTARWPWIAPIVIYAVSALEMIIMISPAAAYFYSVYTPVFHVLEQSPATAWLPQFFLPHLAATHVPVFRWLSLLGAALTLVGLVGFLVCAIQLYYGKFVKKQLVSGGLYSRVRHPQYLLLAIAGVGLLLLWPRFFILVSFLVMLGLYYLLARHEEDLIRKRYGTATDDYLASVPMFNPLRGRRHSPGARAVARAVARGRAFVIWLLISAGTLAVAFLVRSVAIDQLYIVRLENPDVTTLSLKARPDEELAALTRAVLATPAAEVLTAQEPGIALFIQVSSGSSQLKHLLIDLGMREDTMSGIESDRESAFAVASRVVPRDPAAAGRSDPLAFGTAITPLFYARVAAGSGTVAVFELPPENFHPEFSRIRF